MTNTKLVTGYEAACAIPDGATVAVGGFCGFGSPDEVRQDAEGMQIMRTLGENMAWLLRCIEAGKAAGVPAPAQEPRARTNFIR